MRRILILLILLLITMTLQAECIVFDELITLMEPDNLVLKDISTRGPNANIILVFDKIYHGEGVPHVHLFNSDYQPLWDAPLRVPDLINVAPGPDNSVMVIYQENVIPVSAKLDTYDANKEPVPQLSGLSLGYRALSDTKFLTDNSGGLHIIHRGAGIHYQYLSAAGEFAYPVDNPLLLPQSWAQSNPDLYWDEDYGLLLGTELWNGVYLAKIGLDHQLAWYKVQELGTRPYNVKIALRADAKIYLAWEASSRVKTQLLDAQANFLWDQDWEMPATITQRLEAIACSAAGDLILHYWQETQYASNENLGLHCLEVLNHLGESLHSFQPESEPYTSGAPCFGRIIFDDAGGWFFIGSRKKTLYPTVFVQHYDSDFQSWPERIAIPATGHVNTPYYAAWDGENLHVGYTYFIQESDSIWQQNLNLQKINPAGELAYQQPGIELIQGDYVLNQKAQYLAMENGYLVAAWQFESQNTIYYQVLKPNGELYYPQPQTIDLYGHDELLLMETADHHVMILKKGYNEIRGQVIDLVQGALWPAGGKSFLGNYVSCYKKELMVAQVIDNNIYLQRYVDGEAVWPGNGILTGTPESATDRVYRVYLKENTVAWDIILGGGGGVTISYYNQIDEFGNLKYPAAAVPLLFEPTGDYVGSCIRKIFFDGTGLVFNLAHLYWDWGHEGGPSSPPVWMLYGDPAFRLFYEDDVFEFIPVNDNVGVCAADFVKDKTLYSIGNFSQYITKTNLLDGNISSYQVAGHTLFGQSMLEDGRLLWYARKDNESVVNKKFYYGFLNQDGLLSYPPDAMVSDILCNNMVKSDFGIYFISVCYRGIYVQYMEIDPWEESTAPSTPPLALKLSNYPNPFNPSTNIRFELPQRGPAKLEIFNLKGQLIDTILDEYLAAGQYSFPWEAVDKRGRALASGVYFYRLKSGKHTLTRKMMLVK